MRIDDDDVWLDALAGRAEGSEPTAALQEGRAVRVRLRAAASEAAPEIPAVDAARETQLIKRARAEELLPRAPRTERASKSHASTWSRRPLASRGALAAAALATVALAVGLVHFLSVPTEALRGTLNGTVLLEAQNPRALKRELIEELGAAGVQPRGYEQLNRVGIDADLPEPIPTVVRRILEQHHIPVPNDGALTVEIVAPSNR
jgi:hypothetical protein